MAPKSIVPTHFGLGGTIEHSHKTSCTNLSRLRGWYATAHHREQGRRWTTSYERKRTKSEKINTGQLNGTYLSMIINSIKFSVKTVPKLQSEAK
jgi:hypothetical protein